jgi:hypothetical protein
MKKICIAFVSSIIGITGFAQGQVHFKTHITSDFPPVDAMIFLSKGGFDGLPATDGFGQLFIKSGTSYTPLSPAAPFGTTPGETGYIDGGNATAPAGYPGGATVTLVLRAWLGASGSTYDSTPFRGESTPITITLQEAPNAIPDLIGLQGFALIPEPASLSLGLAGLGGLLLWRGAFRRVP